MKKEKERNKRRNKKKKNGAGERGALGYVRSGIQELESRNFLEKVVARGDRAFASWGRERGRREVRKREKKRRREMGGGFGFKGCECLRRGKMEREKKRKTKKRRGILRRRRGATAHERSCKIAQGEKFDCTLRDGFYRSL